MRERDDQNQGMYLRLFENLDIWFPEVHECEGMFDFPIMSPQSLPIIDTWLPVNEAKRNRINDRVGIQMFVHDYRMLSIWRYPHRWLPLFKEAGCVVTPDFSMYTDIPKAMQIIGAYRRQWLGAWWQRQGLEVIPTAGWSSESSYDWCFDGMPTGGCVAVSSVGKEKHFWTKRLFQLGYDAMLERCQPDEILFFGKVPDGLRGNIIPVKRVNCQTKRSSARLNATGRI